ncbi:MAG: YqiA/YcfP family alpha/beta fold hydrolase [Psychromonas sp.]
MAKVLLALHGFHSSPESLKIQQMSAYLADKHPEITFVCPQLPCFPEPMWQVIESVFKQYKNDQIAVMGSSLGGYLATKAAQQYGIKVLLINPAVYPFDLLEHYAGLQVHPYTHISYQINESFFKQLKALNVQSIANTDDFWVLLQKGDEVLNYQQACDKYQLCKVTCEEGGDHSFINFDRFIPEIIKFLF